MHNILYRVRPSGTPSDRSGLSLTGFGPSRPQAADSALAWCSGTATNKFSPLASIFQAIAALSVAGVFWAAQAQSPAANSPTVKVGAAVGAMAAAPGPSPTARNQSQKTSIGKDTTSVRASSPSAYWTDLVDINDDGQIEDNQFLYDAKRGILYTYREDNFSCANGNSANGDVLMGIYPKGNKAGKPVGSGWYMVALKAGQCGEKKAGTFGCKFDASGKPTVCGSAKVDDKSGELEIVVAGK